MIITVDYARFEQELRETERLNHFKHTAELVFEQIQQREDETGDTYELDGVTIATEWLEKSFDEIIADIPSQREITSEAIKIVKGYMSANYYNEFPYMVEPLAVDTGKPVKFYAFHEQDYNELLDDLAELIDQQIAPEVITDEIDELISELESLQREVMRNEWKATELEDLAETIRDYAETTAREIEKL